MPGGFLFSFLFVLLSAFFGGFLAVKMKQPLLLGYLLSGLFVSVLGNVFGLDKKSLISLTEVGLALLMFTLGLEFSFKRLEKLKTVIIGGAFLQIIGTIFFGVVLCVYIFHFDFKTSLVLSSAFSLSSTAIIVKILSEKGQTESLPGEIMEGWLLVQDLAVLPMIAIFPVLFSGGKVSSNLVIFWGALFLVALVWISARKIIPKLTDIVSSFKSRELLLIFAVCLIFLFSILTRATGFSYGLGAFLAGLILSQATAHFAIFSEIRPLKDVFLAVFFVSLGLSLDPGVVFSRLPAVLLVGASFILLKIILTALILIFFKFHAKVIVACSFGLSQIGEFAFVLASTALAAGFLSPADYSLISLITLFSMVFTPFLFLIGDNLYLLLEKLSTKFPKFNNKFFLNHNCGLPIEELPFSDHAVILGYGRVGSWVGNIFEKAKIPYLVIEYNPQIVRELKLRGKKVIFGDPTNIDVLDLAQVDKAKIVVIAVPDSHIHKSVIANCQALNPKVKIICRSHLEEDKEKLLQLGADNIIQPEFEAALSIAHRCLQYFGFNKEEISQKIKSAKDEHDK